MYGVAFNPLRPTSGRGCEFLTFGMKHLKSWVLDDAGTWLGTAASFGPEHVQNVHCAVFVPAQHSGRAPGDSCIVSGFPDGSLGMWVPPFPTKAGSRYALKKIYKAHEPGPLITMVDGSQQYGGVRCLTVCKKPEEEDEPQILLSGGADGAIRRWQLRAPTSNTKVGLPQRGAVLAGASGEAVRIREPSLPDQGEVHPMVKGMDWHHAQVCFCRLLRVLTQRKRQQPNQHRGKLKSRRAEVSVCANQLLAMHVHV